MNASNTQAHLLKYTYWRIEWQFSILHTQEIVHHLRGFFNNIITTHGVYLLEGSLHIRNIIIIFYNIFFLVFTTEMVIITFKHFLVAYTVFERLQQYEHVCCSSVKYGTSYNLLKSSGYFLEKNYIFIKVYPDWALV